MRRPCALLLVILPLAPAFCLEPEGVRPFTIRSDKRSATVSAENRWIASQAAQTAERNGLYRQSVELDFSGSVYHRNFLTYALASQLGVSEWEGGTAEQGPAYGLIADLHFLASFLQEKPYPFSFHFDRRDDYQEYSLFDRARVAETALGGSGHWANGWAPLHLSVEQSWKQEQQPTRTTRQDALVVRAGLERGSDDRKNLTRADYTFTDFDRRTLGVFAQQGTSHEARLSNNFAFGGDRQHGLSSSLRYLNLSGTLDQSSLDLTELLRLQLPRGFSGQALYALRGAWDGRSASAANRGRLQASHQLYDSLTSTLGLDGSLVTASSFRQSRLGPDLDLRYRKKIRIGTLNLDYRLDAEYEGREVSAQTLEITDESHILEDGVLTFLDLPNVVLASVEVTDELGNLYTEDDYILTEIGGFLRLARSLGSGIPDGGTVLVDYSAINNPSFQSVLLAQAAGVRLELLQQRLAFYYRYRGRRYPYASGLPAQDLTDDHVLGLGLSLPRAQAGAEYEHHGSSLLSYDALRGRQSLSLPVGDRSLFALQAAESLTRFTAQRLTQGFLEVTARYNLSAGPYLALSAAGGCRLQGESDAALQPLWSAQAAAEFHRGLLTASAGYRFLGPLTGQDHTLSISVTRRF